MMSTPVFLLLVATASAAVVPHYAAPRYDASTQDFVIDMDENSTRESVVFPRERRAALVLDRLLVALQKALHEDAPPEVDDGPRAAPLRYLDTDDMTGLQRRGQGMSRGRVLRCYFNAITCF